MRLRRERERERKPVALCFVTKKQSKVEEYGMEIEKPEMNWGQGKGNDTLQTKDQCDK